MISLTKREYYWRGLNLTTFDEVVKLNTIAR
jgi:hypothetical protein